VDLSDRIEKRPPITEEQRIGFLELIADGKTRQEAAEAVGSTGTRFRGLIGRDEAFAQQYAEALESAGNPENPLNMKIESLERLRMLERMLDEYIMRALDAERGKSGSSNRALANLLTLLHDTFKPFLEARTRHIHEGAVGVYALPQIDTDKWSLEEHNRFVELRKEMNALLAKARPEGAQGFPELEAAPPDDDDPDGGSAGVREPRIPPVPPGTLGAEADIIEDAQFEEVDAA
jgi:hypothetical protein